MARDDQKIQPIAVRMDGVPEPAFADAQGLWLPAAFSRDLRERPRAVDVSGVRLALFRDARGQPAALVDRCPHRGVRLSLGRVEAGCLECPYHGWRFAGDGACTHVPLAGPTVKRERLGARAVPAVERGGLIWIFAELGVRPDDPRVAAGPAVPAWLERTDLRRREAEYVWRCHWTRLAENMLDVPHLPYVHRKTIGRSMREATDRPLNLHVELEDRGFSIYWDTSAADPPLELGDPEVRAGRPWLRWLRPCTSVLELSGPQGEYRQHLFCVPGKAGETRLMLVSTRRFVAGVDRLVAPLMNWFEDRIVNEDRQIIESSDPPVIPPPGGERSVATDGPTLRFRKWYWAHRRSLEAQRDSDDSGDSSSPDMAAT